MAIHEKGPEGPETPQSKTFHQDYKEGQEPLPAEADALAVEFALPSLDLYVSTQEGIATPGWHAVRTDMNPETGREETVVEREGQTLTVDTEKLDELQVEMYRANTALRPHLAEKAMHLIGVEAPDEAKESRVNVTVIHGAQGPEAER